VEESTESSEPSSSLILVFNCSCEETNQWSTCRIIIQLVGNGKKKSRIKAPQVRFHQSLMIHHRVELRGCRQQKRGFASMSSKVKDQRWNRRPFASLAKQEPSERPKWRPREMREQMTEMMAWVVFLEKSSSCS
jgi:hypothetical protein